MSHTSQFAAPPSPPYNKVCDVLCERPLSIKLYMIVDCETGFVLGLVVYTGADTEYQKFNLGVTGDIVAHFLQPYFYKGHVIYIYIYGQLI